MALRCGHMGDTCKPRDAPRPRAGHGARMVALLRRGDLRPGQGVGSSWTHGHAARDAAPEAALRVEAGGGGLLARRPKSTKVRELRDGATTAIASTRTKRSTRWRWRSSRRRGRTTVGHRAPAATAAGPRPTWRARETTAARSGFRAKVTSLKWGRNGFSGVLLKLVWYIWRTLHCVFVDYSHV